MDPPVIRLKYRRTEDDKSLLYTQPQDSFLLTRSSGFTLIEILIALALLSVILAAIYGTFFLSHRALEGMDESMVRLQESRRALDILKRELDSSVYIASDRNTMLRIVDRDFGGRQAVQLTFTTLSVLRPGLSRITYYIEEDEGRLNLFKKVESPYADQETEGVDIIEDMEAFSIEAKYNDRWVRTWDTEINGEIPSELRIELTVKVKERKVTLFDTASPKVGRTI
jgi:general secretion pathway protein J